MKKYLINRTENIVSKEEIARFEQFLLLSHICQKSFTDKASESVYMWERVNDICGNPCLLMFFLELCIDRTLSTYHYNPTVFILDNNGCFQR